MIPINEWSRPGKTLHWVKAIVIHWPDWANRTAKDIYDYFEHVGDDQRYASSQYVVGLAGEVVQVMPETEVAYHCGSSTIDPASGKIYTDRARKLFGRYAADHKIVSPNLCAIGIEVCHVDKNGVMTPQTVEALTKLCAELCEKYGLDPISEILRHYDVVGWKDCPRYWVHAPEEWQKFREEVRLYMEAHK